MTSEPANFAARLRELFTCATLPEATFGNLALELFALQFAANDAYRIICQARHATPQSVKHWTQIPAVPTSAFKELELSCLSRAQRTHVFHSSGTTGQIPSRHFHSPESLALYEASAWPWFRQHLLPDRKSGIQNPELIILTPPPAAAPHSSLIHMFELVRRELGAADSAFLGQMNDDGSWSLDFESTLDALRRTRTSNIPVLLLGTAFSFVHLLDELAERNLRFELPPGSRVMETGGYKGRSRSLPGAELHRFITQRLGVPASHIVCEYGMSELSSQAYRGNHHFHFPPWARVQIISPETGLEVGEGETGLIRVFDLANVFSVLAIQTEDLGIRRGAGFELLGRALHVEPRGCSLMAVNS